MASRITVAHLVPDLEVGGGTRVVLDLIAAGDKSRFRFVVGYIGQSQVLAGSFADLGVPIARLGGGGSLATLARAIRFARREKVDVLHLHNNIETKFGLLTGLALGIPALLHLHWIPRDSEGNPRRDEDVQRRPFWRGLIEDRVVRRYVAPSVAVAEYHRSRVSSVIKIVPNGIRVSEFSERAAAQVPGSLGPNKPVLISVGRLTAEKGHIVLIEAVDRCVRSGVEDFIVRIVGDGPLLTELKERTRELGIDDRVEFLGTRLDVSRLLAMADLFVLPSRTEGFGIAVVEAMASALPVVASDLPALREVMTPGRHGWLAAPGDPDALSVAISEALTNREKWPAIGEAGRVRANDFDIGVAARLLESVYQSVLGKADPTDDHLGGAIEGV